MKHLTALLLAALLAGCGGGTSAPTPHGTQSAAARGQTGAVTLTIPNHAAASATAVRYPQFVSPNAASVSIVINSATPQVFDVSSTSTLCTNGAGGRTCTLALTAPPGNDTFTFTAFGAANASGSVLATATAPLTVVLGTAFDLGVELNAVLGTIMLQLQNPNYLANCPNAQSGINAFVEGCAASATVLVSAFDPSGAQITGSQPFVAPIALTTGDPSISIAPAQITAPGQTATLTYSGAAFGLPVTTTAQVSASAGGQSGGLSVSVVRQYLYAANVNALPGLPATGGGDVEVFTFGASGSATPARVLSGVATQMQVPADLFLDAAGELYVLDVGTTTSAQPQVLVFAPGAGGNVAPIRSITGIAAVDGALQCEAMTLDTAGQNLFVVCDDQAVHVFPALGNGPATILQEYSLQNAGWVSAIGPAFDAAHNLYVTDNSVNAIDEFAPPLPTNGINAPITPAGVLGSTLWAAGVTPLDVRIDRRGNTIASIANPNTVGGAPDAGNVIAIWRNGTLPCNNCMPSATLGGTPFTNHAPDVTAEDGAGNLYVSNNFTNQVYVLSNTIFSTAAGVVTNPSVMRTLATSASPFAPNGLAIGP